MTREEWEEFYELLLAEVANVHGKDCNHICDSIDTVAYEEYSEFGDIREYFEDNFKEMALQDSRVIRKGYEYGSSDSKSSQLWLGTCLTPNALELRLEYLDKFNNLVIETEEFKKWL